MYEDRSPTNSPEPSESRDLESGSNDESGAPSESAPKPNTFDTSEQIVSTQSKLDNLEHSLANTRADIGIEKPQEEDESVIRLKQQLKALNETTESNTASQTIEVPLVEGFVHKDTGVLLEDSAFVSDINPQDFPEELRPYLRPLIASAEANPVSTENVKSAVGVKETNAMGKAAFIERPVKIDGVEYFFRQWKGVGPNQITKELPKRVGENWHFPFGENGFMQMFSVEVRGKDKKGNDVLQHIIVRTKGTAYYDDLLQEKAQYDQVIAKTGLRTPKILATFKFSRQFCQENSLPMPDNDDPESTAGQGLGEYIDVHIDDAVNDEEREFLLSLRNNSSLDFESSAILGENIRLFRNIWRVMEVENALKERDESKRREKLSAILETSKKVFSQEFGQEMNDDAFVRKYSSLLGEQTAILLNHKIIQGAMLEHKQDVTLGAEICDWDTSCQLTKEYLHNPTNFPRWVKDEGTRQEWERQNYLRIYRQVFLVASNIKPVLEMARQMGATETEEAVIDQFTEGLIGGLSEEGRRDFEIFIRNSEDDFQSVEGIAGKIKGRSSKPNTKVLENFEGYQEYFDKVLIKLKEQIK